MGKVVPISHRSSPPNPQVYAPVNRRPTDVCRTLFFNPKDGNEYQDRFDAVGVQYALGERRPFGYHMVEYSDAPGPHIRYIRHLPDGLLYVREHKGYGAVETLPADRVDVVGYIFQFIGGPDADGRWEYIRGPAHEGEECLAGEMPIYDVSR